MLDLTILPFDLGFAFSSSFPHDMIGNFSIGLLQVRGCRSWVRVHKGWGTGSTKHNYRFEGKDQSFRMPFGVPPDTQKMHIVLHVCC